jgi:hypothetical protein
MQPNRPLLKLSLFLGILHCSDLIFAQAQDLQSEHLTKPIGIDAPNPPLTWRSGTNPKNAGGIFQPPINSGVVF